MLVETEMLFNDECMIIRPWNIKQGNRKLCWEEEENRVGHLWLELCMLGDLYLSLEVWAKVRSLPCLSQFPEKRHDIVVNCGQIDTLSPGSWKEAESCLRRSILTKEFRNVLWHESILDYHRGLFDSRQLSTPAGQLYVARLDIDGTQDTNHKSLNRRVMQTSSKMYSAIMNVVIRLFHGMAGSSNLSSRFFTSALVLKGQVTERTVLPLIKREPMPMSCSGWMDQRSFSCLL